MALTPEQIEDRLRELMRWKNGDGKNDFPQWSDGMERRLEKLERGTAWKGLLLQVLLNGIIFAVGMLSFMAATRHP